MWLKLQACQKNNKTKANEILTELESQRNLASDITSTLKNIPAKDDNIQLNMFAMDDHGY